MSTSIETAHELLAAAFSLGRAAMNCAYCKSWLSPLLWISPGRRLQTLCMKCVEERMLVLNRRAPNAYFFLCVIDALRVIAGIDLHIIMGTAKLPPLGYLTFDGQLHHYNEENAREVARRIAHIGYNYQ